jgi:hypothetical protein
MVAPTTEVSLQRGLGAGGRAGDGTARGAAMWGARPRSVDCAPPRPLPQPGPRGPRQEILIRVYDLRLEGAAPAVGGGVLCRGWLWGGQPQSSAAHPVVKVATRPAAAPRNPQQGEVRSGHSPCSSRATRTPPPLAGCAQVEMCTRDDNHDWARCPYAHAKEKARRRDPARFQYASMPCPHTMQVRLALSCRASWEIRGGGGGGGG